MSEYAPLRCFTPGHETDCREYSCRTWNLLSSVFPVARGRVFVKFVGRKDSGCQISRMSRPTGDHVAGEWSDNNSAYLKPHELMLVYCIQ